MITRPQRERDGRRCARTSWT